MGLTIEGHRLCINTENSTNSKETLNLAILQGDDKHD